MSVNRSLSLHDALPISGKGVPCFNKFCGIVEKGCDYIMLVVGDDPICTLLITPEFLVYSQIDYSVRSEEHTSELQSRGHLVCRLLLEKKNTRHNSSNWP